MLMDAGADAMSAVPLLGLDGVLFSNDTPLVLVGIYLSEKCLRGKLAM